MDWANYSYLFWIAAGIFLMFIELIVPGVFIVFIGIGGVLTGVMTYLFGFGIVPQVITWIFSSFFIVLLGAPLLKKIFPSDSKYIPLKEDDSIGKIVKVVATVNSHDNQGRIRYQGTEWNAVCKGAEISVSTYVKILARNNLTFLVEKASESEVENFLNSLKDKKEPIKFDSF